MRVCSRQRTSLPDPPLGTRPVHPSSCRVTVEPNLRRAFSARDPLRDVPPSPGAGGDRRTGYNTACPEQRGAAHAPTTIRPHGLPRRSSIESWHHVTVGCTRGCIVPLRSLLVDVMPDRWPRGLGKFHHAVGRRTHPLLVPKGQSVASQSSTSFCAKVDILSPGKPARTQWRFVSEYSSGVVGAGERGVSGCVKVFTGSGSVGD